MKCKKNNNWYLLAVATPVAFILYQLLPESTKAKTEAKESGTMVFEPADLLSLKVSPQHEENFRKYVLPQVAIFL